MLSPHPILALYLAGPSHHAEARAQLEALLAKHGSVRATAKAIGRHETTVADWMTRMGVQNPAPQPNARRKAPAKKKSGAKKKEAAVA
jgi:transposase